MDHDVKEKKALERRDILRLGAAAAAGLLSGKLSAEEVAGSKSGEAERRLAAAAPGMPWNPVTARAMPTRNLGRTGYSVGIFSLGGQAAIEQPEQRSGRGADRGARPRPGRQLHRHLGPLRRRRAAGASATSAR